MRINFNLLPFILWIVTAAVGYLIGADFYSAVVGFVTGVCISIGVTILTQLRIIS